MAKPPFLFKGKESAAEERAEKKVPARKYAAGERAEKRMPAKQAKGRKC